MTVTAHIESAAVAGVHALIGELALRTVREGLTNAARHSAGGGVTVTVTGGERGGVAVTVHSEPATGAEEASSAAAGAEATRTEKATRAAPSPGDHSRTAGSGHGIRGLRRRAEALGAELTAGPDPTGFTLALRAPAQPTAADRADADTDAGLRSNAKAARRGALQAAFVPLGIVALALAGFLVVQAVTTAQTAISSRTFAQIELGMTRDGLVDVLPAGIPRPAPVVDEPAPPEDTRCEYFAARDGWLHFTDATYRLCFRDGVLVEKLLLEAR